MTECVAGCICPDCYADEPDEGGVIWFPFPPIPIRLPNPFEKLPYPEL